MHKQNRLVALIDLDILFVKFGVVELKLLIKGEKGIFIAIKQFRKFNLVKHYFGWHI